MKRVLFVGHGRDIIDWLQLGDKLDVLSATTSDAALARLTGAEAFDVVLAQLSCLGRRKRLWNLGRPEVDLLPDFLHGLAQR